MTTIHEIRIISLPGLTIPEGISAGKTLHVTCRLQVTGIHQDWIDATSVAGEPRQVPGSVTIECSAIEWQAT